METDPTPVPHQPSERRYAAPARRAQTYGPSFWLQTLLGVAIAGYGFWMMYTSGYHSPTGFLVACVGVIVAPLGITRLLGGLAAAGLGAWLLVNALGMFDYIYGAFIIFVGGSFAIDGIRTLRGKPTN